MPTPFTRKWVKITSKEWNFTTKRVKITSKRLKNASLIQLFRSENLNSFAIEKVIFTLMHDWKLSSESENVKSLGLLFKELIRGQHFTLFLSDILLWFNEAWKCRTIVPSQTESPTGVRKLLNSLNEPLDPPSPGSHHVIFSTPGRYLLRLTSSTFESVWHL